MSELPDPKPHNTAAKKTASSAMLGVYEEHLSVLKRFVLRLVRSQNDVDDVVQEAFLRAYNAENLANAENKKAILQPRSYLFRVAKNVALNQLRQKSNRPTDFLEDLEANDHMASEFTLEDEVLAQERLGIHCAAVAALPPKCRKVYLMRKVYGMTYKAIADALGISVSSVETHLERGFDKCDAYVEARMGHAPHRTFKPSSSKGA